MNPYSHRPLVEQAVGPVFTLRNGKELQRKQPVASQKPEDVRLPAGMLTSRSKTKPITRKGEVPGPPVSPNWATAY